MASRRRRSRFAALAVLAGLLAACGSAAAPSRPTPAPTQSAVASPSGSGANSLFSVVPVAGHAPSGSEPWYLAVGDSVTFGFSIDPARFGVNSSWPQQLQPLLAASGRAWSLYDTACPSERTDTYLTLCPGRSQVPFLATTSQHDAAMAAVSTHHGTLHAIFVDLGSNDLLRGLRSGATVDTMTATLRTALTRIVTELQAAAPGVPVILCNFYNPLANLQPATRPQLATVNAMVASVAAATHVRLADFFAAVNATPDATDPQLCTYVDCAHGDVHPTVAGQARLAQAALRALDAG
jgi:lysophospholipase L1-like esterase